MLALVFVKALDLHIEQSIGVDFYTAMLEGVFRKGNFVGAFYGHELLLKGRVIRVVCEALEFVEIAGPIATDFLRDEGAQSRVACQQPTAGRNAVSHVYQFIGIEGVEICKEMFLEEFGMERRNSIDFGGAYNREVGHAHHLGLPFFDE